MFNQLNRYGKNSAWAVAVLTMLLMGTGCSNNNNNNSASPSPSPGVTATASSSPEASPTSEATTSPEKEETKTSTGVYNGLSDNHSIEIKSDEGTNVYQIDDATSDKVADWTEGSKITFTYKITTLEADGQSVKQMTITSIEKQ